MEQCKAQRPKRKGVEIPVAVLNNAAAPSGFRKETADSMIEAGVAAFSPGHTKEAQCDGSYCGPAV